MTMSAMLMVLALIAASLCHSGVYALKCSEPLPNNQMLSETECLAGYYKKDTCRGKTLCEKCGKEKYTELNNLKRECIPCTICGENMVTKNECTTQKDRECVCKDLFYQRYLSQSDWICENCATCTNCSKCFECTGICERQNFCKEGQFADGKGICQSCADHNCSDKSCKTFCNPVPTTNWMLILVITLVVLVLLGFLALFPSMCEACCKRQLCFLAHNKNVNKGHAGHDGHNDNPPDMPTLPDLPGDQPNILLPLNTISGSAVKEPGISDKQRHLDMDRTGETNPLIIKWDIKDLTRHEQEREMWPAPVLYAIIRQVPVRRWKEFLRLLSLSDDQMERVELEARGSYLELQYQMLRLWSQMNGACLENIYSTLQYMDLSGCVEDLQEKLQQLQENLV